ncbi:MULTISPECIES: hypothetical protein, partial [unclassified Clostridioides]|nr:hypothetical protein [Clostridioides sp. ES-S-0001-02]MCC0658654.1 hypothetical protein [Clostridioides sp. ES-S-0123-01]MCC0765231.1 hypothetical protein [Clostridioides sp. ES-S-0006-03]
STIIDSIVWDSSSNTLSIVYMGADIDDLVSLSDRSHFCSDGRCTFYKSATLGINLFYLNPSI